MTITVSNNPQTRKKARSRRNYGKMVLVVNSRQWVAVCTMVLVLLAAPSHAKKRRRNRRSAGWLDSSNPIVPDLSIGFGTTVGDSRSPVLSEPLKGIQPTAKWSTRGRMGDADVEVCVEQKENDIQYQF